MADSKREIIDGITNHFKSSEYKNSYVGITSDVESRLFGDHKVSEENGHWIHGTASSNKVAREVQQYFLDAGMDGGPVQYFLDDGMGGPVGSDATSKTVYAYKKTSYTNP